MSSTRKSLSENWLLVEWKSGGRAVVYVRAVVNPVNKELKVGDTLMVNKRGEQEEATLVARAQERDMLDAMMREESAGPSQAPQQEEGEDFSSSASSWTPSDGDQQSDDSGDETKNKKIKLEHYKRQYCNRNSSKKVLTPSNKANAVMDTMNRKRSSTQRDNSNPKMVQQQVIKKYLVDSAKIRPEKQNGNKSNIDVKILLDIKNTFNILFKAFEDMKRPVGDILDKNLKVIVPTVVKNDELARASHSRLEQFVDEDKENEHMSENEEFNRSDDNVLISNKYCNASAKIDASPVDMNEKANATEKEWIPIGSGKTLIHKDKFKRVKWKSYTIATRSLLLAVFPRKILATHSLTGKRSPAFQNKPAKMCLDPKIISDVIMEIMDRFRVPENLVRGIITTKCADECKMWKTRNAKKRAAKIPKKENVPAQET